MAVRGLYFDDLPVDPAAARLAARAWRERAAAVRGAFLTDPHKFFVTSTLSEDTWSGAAGDTYRALLSELRGATEALVAAYDQAASVLEELAVSIAPLLATFRALRREQDSVKLTGVRGATPEEAARLENIRQETFRLRRTANSTVLTAVQRLAAASEAVRAAEQVFLRVSRKSALPDVTATVNTSKVRTKPVVTGQTTMVIDGKKVVVNVLDPNTVNRPVVKDGPPRVKKTIPSNVQGPVAGRDTVSSAFGPGVQGPAAGRDTVSSTPPSAPDASPRGPKPGKFTVRKGDSWWKISETALKDVGLTPTPAQVKTYMQALQKENSPASESFLAAGRVLDLPDAGKVLNVIVHLENP